MNKTSFRNLLISIFAAGLLIVVGPVIAGIQPEDPLQDRIGFVDELLNDSPAARQVEDSDVNAAKTLRGRAIDEYAAALKAHESGDFKAAEVGLSEAMRLMYAAVSATRQTGVATEKSDGDFDNRRASVDALLEAHRRISEEKGRQKEHELLQQEIAPELVAADRLLNAGDSEEARRHLDSAYNMVKAAVKILREGDTLVRELKFESKEDEYLYELDRNDTHKMLIDVLLRDRLEDDRIRERVVSLISAAEELRVLAESQAKDGRFSEAVKTLEQSTRELVKAIRGAGVYIPG